MDSSSTSGAVLDHQTQQTSPPMSLQRYMTLVGWGLIVTTVGQMKAVGNYPMMFLLKDGLHLSATATATFMELAVIAWSFKPIAGLLSDGLPIWGSRRRNYLLLSMTLAGILWLAMAVVPRTYFVLLATAFAFNVMAALGSTVTGGLLVEGAQTHGATGRMSTLRLIVINVSYIVGGPVGGLLASIAFGWTALTGGLLFLSMVPLTLFLLRETPVAKPAGGASEVLKGVWTKLKAVAKCRGLWIAGGFFFLIQVAPGLWTPLFWYQTNTLKFSEKFIGNLDGIFGAVGLIASFVYPFFCRRIRLRYLIAAAISCTILSNLTYLGYTSWKAAIFIHAASGLGLTLAQLPLFDLAARATPKGSESLGYSLMIACWNWGLALSNIIGSELYERFQLTFKDLVWVNAAALGLVLAIVPFLPSALVDRKEGQADPEQPA